MTASTRVRTATHLHGLGLTVIPLNGKIPKLAGWQAIQQPSLDQTLAWAQAGNIGLRTGDGVTVIDFDPGADPERIRELGLAEDQIRTWRATTGRPGGSHVHVQEIVGVKNGVSVLGDHIDVRTRGGQVVLPGSVHPETGTTYAWAPGCAPWECDLAPAPKALLAALLKPKPKPAPRTAVPATVAADAPSPGAARLAKWAIAAVKLECQAVASAPEGTRNDRLNEAAFNLGQLIPGGHLREDDVRDELRHAASMAGLGDAEADATIASGVSKGMASPRTPPPAGARQPRVEVMDEDGATSWTGVLPEVLIPGAHQDGTKQIQQGTGKFAREVITGLPDATIFRNATIPGTLSGSPTIFRELTAEQARMLVDDHVWLYSMKPDKDAGSRREFHPMSADLGRLVVEACRHDIRIPQVRRIVRHPCIVGENWDWLQPGWNPNVGIWYDEPEELRGIMPHPNPDASVIADLLVDFPFGGDRDVGVQDCILFLLTAVLFDVIRGPKPILMITSPMQGTGKSLLAKDVIGGILYGGRGIPVIILGHDEAERQKQMTSIFLDGKSIVLFDNVTGRLNSPTLAAATTGSVYEGRILGVSKTEKFDNNLLVIITGNNLAMTGEIARRCLQIRLQTNMANPHLRTGFKHEDIAAFVRANRRTIMEHILGMAWAFREARHTAPSADVRMGAFEGWVNTVVRCARYNGLDHAMTGYAESVRAYDADSQDLVAFLSAWLRAFADSFVQTKQAMDIVNASGVYGDVLDRAKTEQGRLVALGRHLTRRVDIPVQLVGEDGQPTGETVAITKRSWGNTTVWALRQVTGSA